jgi:hypothetical protein
MNKKWLYGILFLLTLASCQKPGIEQPDSAIDFHYFLLKPGLWKVYEVNAIYIDAPSKVFDTLHYFIKEVQTYWFLKASSDSMIRLERFYSFNQLNSWEPNAVWQMGIWDKQAIQIEDNITYLKIKFPALVGTFWNGDAYNRIDTLNKFNYQITSVDIPYNLDGFSFDSALTVLQKQQESLIDKIDFEEVFVKNLGLVFKKQIDIYSTEVDPAIPIENRVSNGMIYYQELIDYGYE